MKKLIVAAAAIAFISTTAFVPSTHSATRATQNITDTVPGQQDTSSWKNSNNSNENQQNQGNQNNTDTTNTTTPTAP